MHAVFQFHYWSDWVLSSFYEKCNTLNGVEISLLGGTAPKMYIMHIFK